MKKKLVLINPHPKGRHGEEDIRVIVQMPLNLAYIAAHTPREKWDIDLIDEIHEAALDDDGKLTFDADLVGITSLTYQAPRAYKIAEQCKLRGIPVVFGGTHATTARDEAANLVDSVVVGEAEPVWGKLLEDFERGELQKLYDGDFPDLEYMQVHPDRDLFKEKYGYKFSSIVTTKGCPWRCEFCSVPMSSGRTYRERDIEDVLDEMEATPFRGLMFAEDNFYGYKPDSNARARRLFRGMVERGIKKDWFGFSQFSTGHDLEALKDMSESGCLGMLIGMESTDPQVLKKLRKGSNLKTGVENYPSAIQNIHDNGMIVWASVIWGADFQTKGLLQGHDRLHPGALHRHPDLRDPLPLPVHAAVQAHGRGEAPAAGQLPRRLVVLRHRPPDPHPCPTCRWTTSSRACSTCTTTSTRAVPCGSVSSSPSRRTAAAARPMFAYKVSSDWDKVFRQVLDNLYALRESGLYERTMKERGLTCLN